MRNKYYKLKASKSYFAIYESDFNCLMMYIMYEMHGIFYIYLSFYTSHIVYINLLVANFRFISENNVPNFSALDYSGKQL